MWSVYDPAKVKFLLSKGADPKPVAKDENSALVLARQNFLSESVPILLAAGAPDIDGMETATRPLLKLTEPAYKSIRDLVSK